MSNEILKSHEQQFGILCADITTKIKKYSTQTLNENELIKNQTDIINLEQLFQEANELIEQMELEIRDINSKQQTTQEQKQKYVNIIKSYKNELQKLEGEFKRRLNALKTRADLFLTEEIDLDNKQNEENLIKMTSNLENSYKLTLESEDIGNAILSDLSQQREVMQRARDRLRTVNDDLANSSRVLTKMLTRLIQNKIFLFAVFFFLILLFVSVIVFSFRNRN